MMRWRHCRLRGLRSVSTAAVLVGAFTLAVTTAVTPAYADTIRQREWHIDAMQLPDIWKLSNGKGITVAVIDGGVDAQLPDLVGQVLPGKDFSPTVKSSSEAKQYSHGTTMASLIAGSGKGLGGQGAVGVAPGAKILPLRVIYNSNAASDADSQKGIEEDIAKALRFAADSPARVINISEGAYGANSDLDSAVSYALSKGKLIFASVGNERAQDNPVEYPAAIPGVVGVAALDHNGAATSESETGPQVALSAPANGHGGRLPRWSRLLPVPRHQRRHRRRFRLCRSRLGQAPRLDRQRGSAFVDQDRQVGGQYG